MKYIRSGDYTLVEIAKMLGITRERVRQIELQALKKLKSPKVGKQLKEYISDKVQ
jgi:RNA polymerase primary sigma factor